MGKSISEISKAISLCVEARELHKRQLIELRRIAVEDCDFDQEMVAKCSPVDLLDGYIKGVRSAMGDN